MGASDADIDRKNHTTSPTAASASTDFNGAAALDACRAIRERMAAWAVRRFATADLGLTESPEHVEFVGGFVFDRRSPEQRVAFGELCAAARRDRVDLGTRGFYATPGVDFNRETGRGNPFFYFTLGAAAAEVRIDRFTGELTVPRADILIDIGRSINPGIDRGQVIGGFVQGMGWVTGECLVYDERGALLSNSPPTSKLPAASDAARRLCLPATGNPFVLVTLVETTGSTPQDAGTKMLVDAGGLRFGTVGGGKIEQQAIAEAQGMLAAPAAQACTLMEWNLMRDVGMTCGGTVKLLFEAYHTDHWRVVVFGAGHVGQAVVRCLLLLDFQVVCVDSRQEWLERLRCPIGLPIGSNEPGDIAVSVAAEILQLRDRVSTLRGPRSGPSRGLIA